MGLTQTDKDEVQIKDVPELFQELKKQLSEVIVGQEQVVEQVLTALLAEGHVLIVGVPGLAKTLLVSTIARILGLSFSRIQFTPDLMPSDITGTTIVSEDPEDKRRYMKFIPGPVFSNIILADEINRTPPKTQSALLEAMEERHVTQGGICRSVKRPFFVLATQNPIEQEGTYPLPASQLDRFLFNIKIGYPTFEEEYSIMNHTTSNYPFISTSGLKSSVIGNYIKLIKKLSISDDICLLANNIVRSTRPQESNSSDFIKDYVSWGAGPRATQALLMASKARAALFGRSDVIIEDIDAVFLPSLRHRLVLSYYAQAENINSEMILQHIKKLFL